MQSPAPASSLPEPPPAASPQLGRWICQQGGCDPRGCVVCCWCPATAHAAAASMTTGVLAFLSLVTIRTGMIILELAATTTTTTTTTTTAAVSTICAVSSPGKQRIRQQAHNWGGGSVSSGCDPRQSGVCCCCFDDDCALAILRLVTFRTVMTVLLLLILLLRLQPARDSRHTVCLGTSR